MTDKEFDAMLTKAFTEYAEADAAKYDRAPVNGAAAAPTEAQIRMIAEAAGAKKTSPHLRRVIAAALALVCSGAIFAAGLTVGKASAPDPAEKPELTVPVPLVGEREMTPDRLSSDGTTADFVGRNGALYLVSQDGTGRAFVSYDDPFYVDGEKSAAELDPAARRDIADRVAAGLCPDGCTVSFDSVCEDRGTLYGGDGEVIKESLFVYSVVRGDSVCGGVQVSVTQYGGVVAWTLSVVP